MDKRTLQGISEAYLEQQVLGTALEFGWMAHHIRDSRRVLMGEPGYPDWSFAKFGRLVVMELKREGQQPDERQRAWLEALGWPGAGEQWEQHALARLRIFVARPSDWDERRIKRVFQGDE